MPRFEYRLNDESKSYPIVYYYEDMDDIEAAMRFICDYFVKDGKTYLKTASAVEPPNFVIYVEEVPDDTSENGNANNQALPSGIAVEVRDPEFMGPELVEVLRATGAVYCLGLHAKMPPIQDQLPMLRKLWPAPMVCRWNLNPIHGAFGYEDARELYSPYDKTVDEDLGSRQALARVALATAQAGLPAYITISNKAEGSAPLSVAALAREMVEQSGSTS